MQLPLLPGTTCTARQERCGQQVKGNHAGEGAGVVRLHNSVPEPFTCRVGWEHLLWSSLQSFPYCSAVCNIKNLLICHHCTDPLKAFQCYLSNFFFSHKDLIDTRCEVDVEVEVTVDNFCLKSFLKEPTFATKTPITDVASSGAEEPGFTSY